MLRGHPCLDIVHFIEQITAGELASSNYDAAVLLFYDRRAARLIKSAGIPIRIGPLSKISSFYYLNRGVRQRRSRSLQNEAEYNLDLLRVLCPEVKGVKPHIYFQGSLSEKLPETYALLAPQSRGSSLRQ